MPAKNARRRTPAEPAQPVPLGQPLRSLRNARSLSIADVAEGTGISASFISLVERGQSDITIGMLSRLLTFYGVSITDLMPAEGDSGYPQVVTRDQRRLVPSPAEGIDAYMLTIDTRRVMQPLLLEFAPGASLAEFGQHPGEGFVHVLEGKLLLELEGVEPRVLSKGDSAYYPNERPHLMSNASDKRPVRVISVDTPPTL